MGTFGQVGHFFRLQFKVVKILFNFEIFGSLAKSSRSRMYVRMEAFSVEIEIKNGELFKSDNLKLD